MSLPTELHVYICSNCQTVATSTFKPVPWLRPIECVMCRRFMAYKWPIPVTMQAHRDLAACGIVFNPFMEQKPYTKKPCETCRTPVERDQMIVLPCVGRFCSEDCAQAGVLKHQQLMERIDRHKQEKPWLYQ